MARLVRPQDRREPSTWPDWVLAPPGGFVDTDGGRQLASERFHAWRLARAEWFAEHGLPVDVQAAQAEHRRRASRGA